MACVSTPTYDTIGNAGIQICFPDHCLNLSFKIITTVKIIRFLICFSSTTKRLVYIYSLF